MLRKILKHLAQLTAWFQGKCSSSPKRERKCILEGQFRCFSAIIRKAILDKPPQH